jgi:hypothetical protein
MTDKETGELIRVPKQNPEYDSVLETAYHSRAVRDEWHVVGLMGQHYVRIDETVSQGDYLTARNGIGTKASEGTWKVMKITTAHTPKKGYGIALTIIR